VGGKILYYRTDSAPPVDLARLDPKSREMRSIRGSAISIIFQEPMTCLSPVHTVGNQIIESLRVHEKGISRSQARDRAIELLRMVGMPSPETRIDAYSFELSGGMRQRAMIAVGISAGPELLIADEPTTAVDVTIQAKVLALLKQLQRETSMSVLFITHDLGIIADMSDDVVVMYLGNCRGWHAGADIQRPATPLYPCIAGLCPTLESRPQGAPYGDSRRRS
jgi:peptide/nickel transport system ATP-binding protein